MIESTQFKDFFYEAKGSKGQKVSSTIKATSITMAKLLLRKQGLTDIKLKAISKSKLTRGNKSSRIRSEDIAIFVRQMATMISAGIPIVQSLQVVIEGSEKESFAKVIRGVKDDVESGLSFSNSLRKYPQVFDELICNLVEAGEISGTLDKLLERIAVYKEKSETLKRKIKKAMYYPVTILIIAAIVTVILLVKVVPTFKELFGGFGAQLPAFTLFVLNISEIIQKHGLIIMGIIVALTFLFLYAYKKVVNFRNFIQTWILKVPIFGSILHKAAIARFARTLSTTFAAGVPLTESLVAVAKSSGNIVFFNAILQIKENVSAGQQMQQAISRCGIFPNMVTQMIAIGEESGTLEEMLAKVANIFEEEVDTAVDGLTTLLEPLIMLILGVIVGGLVIAMYLPIFKLGSVI